MILTILNEAVLIPLVVYAVLAGWRAVLNCRSVS